MLGTAGHCMRAAMAARWPAGFSRPRREGATPCVPGEGRRRRFQCIRCRHQTSMIVSTVFASTKPPLTVWFLAVYLLSQAKTGMYALAL